MLTPTTLRAYEARPRPPTGFSIWRLIFAIVGVLAAYAATIVATYSIVYFVSGVFIFGFASMVRPIRTWFHNVVMWSVHRAMKWYKWRFIYDDARRARKVNKRAASRAVVRINAMRPPSLSPVSLCDGEFVLEYMAANPGVIDPESAAKVRAYYGALRDLGIALRPMKKGDDELVLPRVRLEENNSSILNVMLATSVKTRVGSAVVGCQVVGVPKGKYLADKQGFLTPHAYNKLISHVRPEAHVSETTVYRYVDNTYPHPDWAEFSANPASVATADIHGLVFVPEPIDKKYAYLAVAAIAAAIYWALRRRYTDGPKQALKPMDLLSRAIKIASTTLGVLSMGSRFAYSAIAPATAVADVISGAGQIWESFVGPDTDIPVVPEEDDQDLPTMIRANTGTSFQFARQVKRAYKAVVNCVKAHPTEAVIVGVGVVVGVGLFVASTYGKFNPYEFFEAGKKGRNSNKKRRDQIVTGEYDPLVNVVEIWDRTGNPISRDYFIKNPDKYLIVRNVRGRYVEEEVDLRDADTYVYFTQGKYGVHMAKESRFFCHPNCQHHRTCGSHGKDISMCSATLCKHSRECLERFNLELTTAAYLTTIADMHIAAFVHPAPSSQHADALNAKLDVKSEIIASGAKAEATEPIAASCSCGKPSHGAQRCHKDCVYLHPATCRMQVCDHCNQKMWQCKYMHHLRKTCPKISSADRNMYLEIDQEVKREAMIAQAPQYNTARWRAAMGKLVTAECHCKEYKCEHFVSQALSAWNGIWVNTHSLVSAKFIKWADRNHALPAVAHAPSLDRNSDLTILRTMDGAPAAIPKKSFAIPEVNQKVVLLPANEGVSSTATVTKVFEMGPDGPQCRAGYSSIAGDCGGPVLNSNSQCVGIHFKAGRPSVDNLFIGVSDKILALPQKN